MKCVKYPLWLKSLKNKCFKTKLWFLILDRHPLRFLRIRLFVVLCHLEYPVNWVGKSFQQQECTGIDLFQIKRMKHITSRNFQEIPLDLVKDTDSMESIYFLGHDENQKWTSNIFGKKGIFGWPWIGTIWIWGQNQNLKNWSNTYCFFTLSHTISQLESF